MVTLVITIAAALLDQLSKAVVTAYISVGDSVTVIPGLLWLTHRENTGAAFSLFTGQTPALITVTLAAVTVFAFLWRAITRSSLLIQEGVGLVVGGALGNLIDRVRVGAVLDWVQVPYWPIFNLADSLIVIGVGILLWQLRKS